MLLIIVILVIWYIWNNYKTHTSFCWIFSYFYDFVGFCFSNGKLCILSFFFVKQTHVFLIGVLDIQNRARPIIMRSLEGYKLNYRKCWCSGRVRKWIVNGIACCLEVYEKWQPSGRLVYHFHFRPIDFPPTFRLQNVECENILYFVVFAISYISLSLLSLCLFGQCVRPLKCITNIKLSPLSSHIYEFWSKPTCLSRFK